MSSSLVCLVVCLFFLFQKFYKVVPIKDIRNLYVTFPIPDLQKYYKSNPGHYLGHLIGHEGPGSLLSELKSKGTAFIFSSSKCLYFLITKYYFKKYSFCFKIKMLKSA